MKKANSCLGHSKLIKSESPGDVGLAVIFLKEVVSFNSNTPLGRAGGRRVLMTSGVEIIEPHKFIFNLHLFVPSIPLKVLTYIICPHNGSTRWALFVTPTRIRMWGSKSQRVD